MNRIRTYFIISLAAAALAALASCGSRQAAAPAIARDADVEAKVEKVLKGMTLKEKAGQMVQLTVMVVEDDTHEAIDPAKLDKIIGEYKVGSILNVMHDAAHTREHTAAMVKQIQDKSMEVLGIPCIYGLDMIHGASYLIEGSMYPQEINLGETNKWCFENIDKLANFYQD